MTPSTAPCRNRVCQQAPEFGEILGHNGDSHRVIGALVRGGVTTLTQVHAVGDADLLKIRGVGKQTLQALKNPRPSPRPAHNRRLPVTSTTIVQFVDQRASSELGYRQRRYVVVASPHGEEPTVTIYGDFFSDEAAARWAGKHVPSGHDWVVALINRPRRQGWGHDQTGLVNDQHDGSCL